MRRNLCDQVLANPTGTTQLRSVLGTMIAHSDNTASDIALAACRVEKVRALIAQTGLANTQIPASTRLPFSYLAGDLHGVNLAYRIRGA